MKPEAKERRSAYHRVFWLAAYVAVVLAPLVVLLLAPTPQKRGFVWDLAIGCGFAGLLMMGAQFLLTARFRRATAPFGIDAIYYFHRYIAYVLLALVVAHPALLLMVEPGLWSELNPWTAPLEITAGLASLLLLLVLTVTSAFRKRLRISYDAWRIAHLVLAVGAVGLAFAHMSAIGYWSGTWATGALWSVIGLSLIGVVVRMRLWRPLMLRRTPWRVRELRPERGDAFTLALEPDGHEGFSFEPGQFVWITLRSSPFAMKEHPFSIASSPEGGKTIELTIKERGDFTRALRQVKPGEIAHVEGPYGAFSIDRHPHAPGYVFIAGGIGIAPMMSMLRALADRGDTRPHRLFAAHSRWDRSTCREALSALQTRLDLEVIHVLEEPPDDWAGEHGRIDRALLDRHLPDDRARYTYFLCGPVPMLRAVDTCLHELGVPPSRRQTELFDLV